tara:strand:- start:34708 stop:34941 length:234 start_codon:yes stop_codon:yes gene_type:complete
MTPVFKPGDKVAYTWMFLESIGMSHSEMGHWRGKVLSVTPRFGVGLIIEVQWEPDNIMKVLDSNLAIVGPNMRFCKC